MIYKISTDGTRVCTTPLGDEAGTVEFETSRLGETLSVDYLKGEEAATRIAELRVLDAIRFGEVYGGGPVGRTTASESTVRRAVRAFMAGSAAAATLSAVAFVVAPNPQAPTYPRLYDIPSGHVLTPGERATSETDRGGKRVTLAPTVSPRPVQR